MDQLDADTVPLRCPATLQLMKRDIVQFVPYRNFKSAGHARLAQEVLAEVPGQMLGYFESMGITPNVSQEDIAAQKLRQLQQQQHQQQQQQQQQQQHVLSGGGAAPQASAPNRASLAKP